MLITIGTMLAFSGVYTLIATLVSAHWAMISSALHGGVTAQASVAPVTSASRSFNRA
jgi:hypothetical protein